MWHVARVTLNAGCSFYHGASVAPQSGNEDGATRRMMGLSSHVGSLPTRPRSRARVSHDGALRGNKNSSDAIEMDPHLQTTKNDPVETRIASTINWEDQATASVAAFFCAIVDDACSWFCYSVSVTASREPNHILHYVYVGHHISD